MEKLDPTTTSASPPDLPRSSSSASSSPSCASIEQHSPLQDKPSLDASSHGDNNAVHRGPVDIPTSGLIWSPVATTIALNSQHADTAAAHESIVMETKEEDGEEEEERQASSTTKAASANSSPSLSSPPPLLPAPAKTSPCHLPPPTSTASLPSSSSSTPLPPHIPVISLGHSKPPLPFTNTPLTALHPIPNLLHGLHGDLRRSQLTYLPVASPGSSVGSGGPSAPSPGSLFPQQYMSAHSFFTRWVLVGKGPWLLNFLSCDLLKSSVYFQSIISEWWAEFC